MIHIDPAEFDAYMELLSLGLCPEEIEQRVLDPMDEEIQEESERLKKLLNERFRERSKENEKRLSEVSAIDITQVANLEIAKNRDQLQKMNQIMNPLLALKSKREEELRKAHQAHEELMKGFHRLHMELKNIPKDPKWIDVDKLAKRGSEVCGSSQKLVDSKSYLDFGREMKEQLQRNQSLRIDSRDTEKVKKIEKELKDQNERP